MNVTHPGLIPATALLARPRPVWIAEWAEFATQLRFEQLSASVVSQARRVMFDCVGAICAGMQEPDMCALAVRLERRGGGAVPAIGAGIGLRFDDAAFLNASAGTALELDEGNQFARGHPGMHVLPAALSAAIEQNASGRDLLLAFVLGYDFAARLGAAVRMRPAAHSHGTWGTPGSAVAVALLNGADQDRLCQTVNVAASLCSTASLRAMLEGATVRNAYCGLSNRNALTAWDLVASGFTGEIDAFDSVFGSILSDEFRSEVMVEALGTRFEIERNYFKAHAACRFTHGALDVIGRLMQRADFPASEAIAAIEVETYANAAQLDNPAPHNMLAAKFSIPFSIATAIVTGETSVAAFRQPAVEDASTLALAARVQVRETPGFTAQLPSRRPSRVTVRLKDGRVLAGDTMTNRGDAFDPYTDKEIRAKFMDLAAAVWGHAHAARVLDAIEGIDAARDLSTLKELLTASPAGL